MPEWLWWVIGVTSLLGTAYVSLIVGYFWGMFVWMHRNRVGNDGLTDGERTVLAGKYDQVVHQLLFIENEQAMKTAGRVVKHNPDLMERLAVKPTLREGEVILTAEDVRRLGSRPLKNMNETESSLREKYLFKRDNPDDVV